jgi:hypothetical protein
MRDFSLLILMLTLFYRKNRGVKILEIILQKTTTTQLLQKAQIIMQEEAEHT